MKRFLSIMAALALLLGTAQASETFDGTVIAGETVSVTAPYGGTVDQVLVKAGEVISAGEEIITVEAERVIATEDGTIRGVFAMEGYNAQNTVMYLAPVSKYTVSASVSKAYSSAATKYVTIGETVYIRCVKDGTHQARGVITAVEGTSYTVQTTAGELYMEETVEIFRTADYDDKSSIGRGTVSRTDAIAMSGTGSILRMHVSDGEEVERGQTLFETVSGVIDEAIVADPAVRSQVSGVVAEVKAQAGQTVSQGDVILQAYQPEDYLITFAITEDMLSSVQAGDEVQIYFNWNEDKSEPFTGTVTEVSYIGAAIEGSSDMTYTGYIAFEADDTVRLGMNVTIVTQ